MSSEFDIQDWQGRLETHLNDVYEKSMSDLPIVNHKLAVGIVDFSQLRPGRYLGVVVTPWFVNMSFKLVDENGEDLHNSIFNQKIGETVQLKFPAGQYEFIVNHQPDLGYFYSCALISDMHTLSTQEEAMAVALECKRLLFDEKMSEKAEEQPLTPRGEAIETVDEPAQQTVNAQDGEQIESEKTVASDTPSTEAKKSIETTNYSRRSLFGLRPAKDEA